MVVLWLISSISSLVHCISDTTQFENSKPTAVAKLIVANVTKDTLRECQIECADKEPMASFFFCIIDNCGCTALFYAFPNCVMLGDQTDGTTCGSMRTFLTKVVRPTVKVDRYFIIQDLDYLNDPCIYSMQPNLAMPNQEGICPRDDKNLIIRAVHESGVRVTYDNEIQNVYTFVKERNMWKLTYAPTGFETWLVALCCIISKPECTCDSLPQMNASWGIIGGADAQINAAGACADRNHQLTYWGGKFKPGQNKVELLPETAAIMRITCQAGIWLLTYEDNSNGWQITNATCSPRINRDPAKFDAEMGSDPCVTQLFPTDTKLDVEGICPRDKNIYVIRGISEAGLRVTFDNNIQNVLTFDSARNMWKFFYAPTNFERWLVAVSCVMARSDGECGCRPLPMIDGSWGIPAGVAGQVNAPGVCADPSHDVTFWGGKFAVGQQPSTAPSSVGANYEGTCQAGIWLFRALDYSDDWEATNITCSAPTTVAA